MDVIIFLFIARFGHISFQLLGVLCWGHNVIVCAIKGQKRRTDLFRRGPDRNHCATASRDCPRFSDHETKTNPGAAGYPTRRRNCLSVQPPVARSDQPPRWCGNSIRLGRCFPFTRGIADFELRDFASGVFAESDPRRYRDRLSKALGAPI
ncbi:MAG: hypothetical protein ACREBD_36965 [Blastocatellia bacterium]